MAISPNLQRTHSRHSRGNRLSVQEAGPGRGGREDATHATHCHSGPPALKKFGRHVAPRLASPRHLRQRLHATARHRTPASPRLGSSAPRRTPRLSRVASRCVALGRKTVGRGAASRRLHPHYQTAAHNGGRSKEDWRGGAGWGHHPCPGQSLPLWPCRRAGAAAATAARKKGIIREKHNKRRAKGGSGRILGPARLGLRQARCGANWK